MIYLNRVYEYKGNFYKTLSHNANKNAETRHWEENILYLTTLGILCSRNAAEFERLYKLVDVDANVEKSWSFPTMITPRKVIIDKLSEIYNVDDVVDYIESILTLEVELSKRNIVLLQSISIVDRLEKYISEAAKRFWLETNNYIDDTPYVPGDINSNLLHACWMGFT